MSRGGQSKIEAISEFEINEKPKPFIKKYEWAVKFGSVMEFSRLSGSTGPNMNMVIGKILYVKDGKIIFQATHNRHFEKVKNIEVL